MTSYTKKVDLIVILGNKVNEDGTLSERLKARMIAGLELFKHGKAKRILVSGGLGKEGFYEGSKMKEFLLKNDVPDSVILVDNKGNNTLLTVQNTLKLKDEFHFKSITVISQFYHVTRTKMLFRKEGFSTVYSASANYFELRDFYAVFREFFAYYSEVI